jgi:hypothetical protein
MRDSRTAAGDVEPSRSDEALARYNAQLRRPRLVYAAAIAVVVAVVAFAVTLAYSRGEISHVTLQTEAHPPAPVTPQATTPTPESRWTSKDTTALGVPFDDGTVITHDAHAVRGRNAETGAVTWSYTRTDRTVCAALQTQGVTVALYRDDGNCDELTALDSQTGQRRWTRTLDEDGVPFNGTARYQIMGDEVLFVSRTAIYALSVSGDQYGNPQQGGIDNWTFSHYGCTIADVALGSTGALISQTCRHEPCAGLRECRDGPQLLLRPAYDPQGVSDAKKAANPDYITWNVANPGLTPVTADTSVTAVDPRTHQLDLLDARTGRTTRTLALLRGSDQPASTATATDASLIGIGYNTYALFAGQTRFAWHARTSSPLTVSPPDTDPEPDSSTTLGAARIFEADDGTADRLAGASGRLRERYPLLPSSTADSRVYPLGNGLLVTGRTTSFYD